MTTTEKTSSTRVGSRGEVLVVEDTPASLRLLTDLLTRAGYAARPAQDGRLGLASAMVKPPDLALLDIRMPGLDGFELCRLLKADPRTREVPVVFLSALQDSQDKLQGFRVGGVDYITKPYQAEEVLARVRTHVELRRLQVDLESQVRSRSSQLEEANRALRSEVAEHCFARASLERSRRAYRALSRCHRAVAYASDEDRLAEEICRVVCEECGHRSAWVALEEPGPAPVLRAVAQVGFGNGFLARAQAELSSGKGGSALESALRRGEPAAERLSVSEPACAWSTEASRAGGLGVATIPLATGGQLLGALLVFAVQAESFSSEEMQLLQEIAANLAYGVVGLRGQRERRESAERLRRFSEVSAEGIVFCEANKICDANAAFLSMMQLASAKDVIGRGLRELCAPQSPAIDCSKSIGDGLPQEIVLRRRGGEVFPAEVLMRAYELNGKLGSVASVRDITERKRAEAEREGLIAQAQAANRAKDQFLAVLSHELRNPLAAIQGGVEMLRRTEAGEEPRARRALDVVERNVRLQMRLVDDLLDLSRIARGKTHLQRARVRLNEIVLAAAQALRAEAASARIALELHAAPELWVDADPDRLQQIVLNLLSNSLKFTPPGGRVTIDAVRLGERARLSVADTGVGIEPSQLPRIFQMFEQGNERARRAPGLGIGLALVKTIAELHGGRVWAESRGKGLGSRFTVELPLVDSPPARVSREAHEQNRAMIRILLVEDDPDARAMLAETLQLLDYRVLAVESAEAGLLLLRQESVQAILADIGLPGMDGYEFIRRAHRIPRADRLPAFAVSGYGQQSDIRRAREAGFIGHFVKPVDLEALDRRIRECVGGEAAVALH